MDFMLEEELLDLMTFCLQNPESLVVASTNSKNRSAAFWAGAF